MDPSTDPELRIICPVCQQPNPIGTKTCQHCWGAIIHPRSLILTEEQNTVRLANLRRKRITKRIAIGFAVFIALMAIIVFPYVYYQTDTLFAPPKTLNSNSLPGQWAMFRHDTGHTGTVGDTLPQGQVKWTFSTGEAIQSSPAVVNGTVYVGSRDFKLYAIDAATGVKKWEFKTDSWVESSPSVVNGIVYFGSDDGRLYALNAQTGQKIWDFKTDYPVMSSPAITNGVVYFGSDDYRLYALDAIKGTKIWSFDTKGLVKASPVIANGMIYAGSGHNFLYALNARNGSLRLQFKALFPVFSSAAVKDGIVYFINSNGDIYAFKGNARSKPYEHQLRPYWYQLWLMGFPGVGPPSEQSGYLWRISEGGTSSSSPVILENSLYVGTDNKTIALNLDDLKKRWEFYTAGAVIASPAVTDTTVYIGSEDGNLYAVDAVTGDKIWQVATGGRITSSPSLVDGVIYVGSHDGKLYAIK